MTKRWYQSTTIQSSISAYVILLLNTGLAMYSDGTFREPTTAEATALLAGAIALKETIAGRARAQEDLGKPARPEDSPSPSYYYPIEPNYDAVAELPSAEYAIVPDEPVVDEMESIDNEEEDLDIDLDKLKGTYYLVALQDTRLKTSTAQSIDLERGDWLNVDKDKSVFIDAWNYLGEKNDHIAVKIDEYSNVNGGQFFVYAPHFDLYSSLGTKVAIKQATAPISVIDKNLTSLNLPGYSSTFYLENPIYEGSHFTWKEATRNGQRMPSEKRQVDNIIAVARKLDLIREFIGNRPMIITSWLRPEHINRQVGGVKNSRHITGDGVDFTVPAANLSDIQERLKSFCQSHNMGLGLGARRGFIHVDLNGFRVWTY